MDLDAKRRARHLVEPDWLEQRLSDTALRVVDVRGYVRTRDQGDGSQTAEYLGARGEYEESHIPGAVYLDWTRDIVDSQDPVPAQVALPEQAASVFAKSGIGNETQVVVYDNHPASQFATRLWWVLRYYGHTNVRVLDGGWSRWIGEGRLVSTDPVQVPESRFVPRIDPRWRVGWEYILASPEGSVHLVDARDTGQYSGAIRRGPRGGHIPGAINLPRENLTDSDGRFRPSSELRSLFEARGIAPDDHVVAYCNGGVAATSVLFALSMLGYEKLSNYDGSWNEWGPRDDLPVQTGESP